MKKLLVIYTLICMIGLLAACKNDTPWNGEIVIHPSGEVKTDTIAIDSSYLPWCAEISLKGYTKDTLYLSFSDGSFWQGALVGNIDKTIRNDWYSDTLLVTHHTRTEDERDSVVIQYSFGK